MAAIDSEDAIARAREALGVPASAPAEALRVERLDRPGGAYFLVLLPREGDGHIATIDADTGAPDQYASVTEPDRHLSVSREQAIAAANLGRRSSARLVWLPSRASRSPLYPLWEISAGDEHRYIDQQGQLWDELPRDGRGGS
jgi:hypothetical protein